MILAISEAKIERVVIPNSLLFPLSLNPIETGLKQLHHKNKLNGHSKGLSQGLSINGHVTSSDLNWEKENPK